MNLSGYQKKTITAFKGLFARGSSSNVPQDHAVDCPNVWLNSPGDVSTRYGSQVNFALSHNVMAQFLATNSAKTHFLTMDDSGNIYRDDNPSVFIHVPGMVDFRGLNIFNKTIINCIKNAGPPEPLKIWGVDPNTGLELPVRNAAGLAPRMTGLGMSGGYPGTGVGYVDLGWHNIAVSYLTDTGFITPPGPILSGSFFPLAINVTTAGGVSIDVTNIPIGPPGTVGRILLMTKGDEQQYFRIPGGEINDNTTTTFTITSADVELIIDGSYLFDLLETIPGGIGDGGLAKYHGRLFSWGAEGDLIRASYSGDIESIDNVTGYIQVPTEEDGNVTRGAFVLRDVLYFTKSVGILSTQDLNGDEPSSWPIAYVDGSTGAWSAGISTITSSQSGLPLDDTVLLLDYSGLHFFPGVVVQPPLTWKIEDVWRKIDRNEFQKIHIEVDPFTRLLYILIPSGIPYNLLVGDFAEGLDSNNIKWSYWSFPFGPAKSISLSVLSTSFSAPGDSIYGIRLGTQADHNLYVVDPALTTDLGNPILNSYYQTAYVPIDLGSINVYRALRFRTKDKYNSGNYLALRTYWQDGNLHQDWLSLILPSSTEKDLLREINTQDEKVSVRFGGPSFLVSRLDMFGTVKFKSRPA